MNLAEVRVPGLFLDKANLPWGAAQNKSESR